MEVSLAGGGTGISHPLRSWLIPPRRIAGRTYQGECVVARVRHVTYQQQSTIYGSSAGVFGVSDRGTGFVAGGGGFVDTVHRGVVSVVLEDEAGRHVTEELPASVSLLDDGVVRLDRINGHLIAATNLTGRQGSIVLLGPSAFIDRIGFTRLHGVLMVATVMMAGQMLSDHPFRGAALTAACAALPLLRYRRIQAVKRQRDRLKDYMVEVMS